MRFCEVWPRKKILLFLLLVWAIFLVADLVSTAIALQVLPIALEQNKQSASLMTSYGVILGLVLSGLYDFVRGTLCIVLPFVVVTLLFTKRIFVLENIEDAFNMNRIRNFLCVAPLPMVLYLAFQNSNGFFNNVGVIIRLSNQGVKFL